MSRHIDELLEISRKKEFSSTAEVSKYASSKSSPAFPVLKSHRDDGNDKDNGIMAAGEGEDNDDDEAVEDINNPLESPKLVFPSKNSTPMKVCMDDPATMSMIGNM
jgi:hypothetical protein